VRWTLGFFDHRRGCCPGYGGVLGVETFDTTTSGHRSVVRWLAGFGVIDKVGVEGTGSYGAGIARHLTGKGITLVEVDRPNRQASHRGKCRCRLSRPDTHPGQIDTPRCQVAQRRSGISWRWKRVNVTGVGTS
jgi:hypothetical protein